MKIKIEKANRGIYLWNYVNNQHWHLDCNEGFFLHHMHYDDIGVTWVRVKGLECQCGDKLSEHWYNQMLLHRLS